MAFLIQSGDGRLRICTHDAQAAARHVERLEAAGQNVQVTDINGHRVRMGSSRAGNSPQQPDPARLDLAVLAA